MKKVKKLQNISKKTLSGLLGASILTSSCTQYNMEGNIYGHLAPNLIKGEAAIDMFTTNLSDDFFREIDCIASIMRELLYDPQAAKQLVENSEKYFAERELKFALKLSEPEKRLLQAYADPDIIESIKNNDLDTFVKIAKERGYLMLTSEPIDLVSLRKYFATDKDFKLFIDGMNQINITEVYNGFILLPVFAISAFVAIYMVALASVAAIYYTASAYYSIHTATEILGYIKDYRDPYNPFIRLWTVNDPIKGDYSAYEKVINETADEIIRIAEEKVPLKNIRYLRAFIINQLEGYYGIREISK